MDHNTFAVQDGSTAKIAIVKARFNQEITQGLLRGALEVLEASGVREDRIKTVEVPGSFEIIHAANMLAKENEYDAIICLGCIVRGSTKHDEYLAQAVYGAMKDIMLKHSLPVITAVLTVNDQQQAIDRSGVGPMNRGAEAAHVALEMINLPL
ncbi:TPA: 6,7-dimethyl-8-ribityllumazine synthase [Candidatus Uhrbacteria bacterium]|nr:6,7-dimethyl-8-ribityllumazine synthase [Candidatus Uhrbacteria bacterium]